MLSTPSSPSPALKDRKDSKVDKLAYLEESRATKIERYRKKKSRRIWDRKIFYDCRKVVADNRLRVNGRFVKKSPAGASVEPAQNANLTRQEVDLLQEMSPERKSFEDFCLLWFITTNSLLYSSL